jgi:SCP-2 sterol transfer family protein
MSDASTGATTDIAQIVSGLTTISDRDLDDLMSGPNGSAVLDEIVREMREHFRADLAGDETAVVQYVITGGPDNATNTYQLTVRDGKCETSTELSAAKGPEVLKITVNRIRFVRAATGQIGAAKLAALYATRKIKIDGDLKFGGKVLTWFGVQPTE